MNELGLFAALLGVVFFTGALAGLYIGFALGRRRRGCKSTKGSG